MITFKNIISDLSGFCSAHLQINDFDWGIIPYTDLKDRNYPMVWLQPTTTAIEGSLMTMRFTMYVFDIEIHDKSNLLDITNDMLLIGFDVISKFWNNENTYGWTILETTTGEYFDEAFDCFAAGHMFDIEIEISNPLNECSIPE